MSRKYLLFLSAMALAIFFASGIQDPAVADDTSCTGTIGALTVDNLIVPANATCILDGTLVLGNLTVSTNATLYADGVRVNGNIQANGAVQVNVSGASIVDGNVQILDSGSANIRSVNIDGNLLFDHNQKFLQADRNSVSGNLQVFYNTGGVSITFNRIENSLQCTGNQPPPTGTGNIVNGSTEGQCLNFGDDGPTPTRTATSVPPTPTPTHTATTVPPTQTRTPTSTATQTPSTPTPVPPTATAISPTATRTPGGDTDEQAPQVLWVLPVQSFGDRYDVSRGELVHLEVAATDNDVVARVIFTRWDAIQNDHILLARIEEPPYRVAVHAGSLNPGWNQVFIYATDEAGNISDTSYIWLFRPFWLYLPVIATGP